MKLLLHLPPNTDHDLDLRRPKVPVGLAIKGKDDFISIVVVIISAKCMRLLD